MKYEVRTRVDQLGGVLEHGSFLVLETDTYKDACLEAGRTPAGFIVRTADGAIRDVNTPWINKYGEEVE